MPETSSPTNQNNALSDLLQRVGALRDGLLVLASLLYILGYLVWSLNAAANNLGLLPAIDSQYFIAGFVPALIAMLVYFLIRAIKALRLRLHKWMDQSPEAMSRLAIRLVLAVYLAVTIYFLYVRREEPTSWIVLGLPSFLFIDFILGQQDVGTRILTSFYTYLIPLGLGIIGVALYVFAIYPIIPQELGGIRPRCAYLDVSVEDLSSEVLQALLSSAPSSASQVVQSARVNVLYSGSDFLLVRPVVTQSGTQETKIYEIRRSALQAITWCGQGGN